MSSYIEQLVKHKGGSRPSSVAFVCDAATWKPNVNVAFKAWKKDGKVFGYAMKKKKTFVKHWLELMPTCVFYKLLHKDRLAIEQASKAERAESVEGLEIKQILAATRTVDNTEEQEQQVCLDAYLAYLRGMARNA